MILTSVTFFVNSLTAMSQDLANINLSGAEITAMTGSLQTFRTTLGDRAVSLSPVQRQTLMKMGPSRSSPATSWPIVSPE